MILLLGRFWIDTRAVFVTFFLVNLAFFCLFASIYFRNENLTNLEQQIKLLSKKSALTLTKRKKNRVLLKQYSKNKILPNFIEKKVCGHGFLEKEKAWVKKVASHSIFSQQVPLQEIKTFLKNSNLEYEVHNIANIKNAKEQVFVQKHPVHTNFSDLMQLLYLVENPKNSTQRPQLFFTKFQIFLEQEKPFRAFSLNTEIFQRIWEETLE